MIVTPTEVTPAPAPAAPPATTPPAASPPAPVVTQLDGAAAPIEAPASEKEGEVFTYEKTGDVGLDYALTFIGNLGYGHEHPAVAAAMKGEFGLIKADLAAKGDKAKGYAEVIALAEQAFVKTKEAAASKDKEVQGMAVTIAGSPAEWDAIRTWAAANATPDEKKAINAALAAGGFQAKSALTYLKTCYAKSPAATQEPKRVASDNATVSAASGAGPMTAKEYADAVIALQRQHPGRDLSDRPEYKALQQRRLASKRRGG